MIFQILNRMKLSTNRYDHFFTKLWQFYEYKVMTYFDCKIMNTWIWILKDLEEDLDNSYFDYCYFKNI